MTKGLSLETSNQSVNSKLDNLEVIQGKVLEIIEEQESLVDNIRKSLVEVVVIFIDLVDSTKYKIEVNKEPEKWILRLKQFGEIIKEYIEQCNGKVVKYIGDEVMGIFDKQTKVDDAISLIVRIKNIEENLTKITGTHTQVKIALDYGNVFLLKYSGHEELDPQGTPIDRCARIGKYCQAGTILSSYEFVSKCSFTKQWFKLGKVEMKGLGQQPIYQYGEETIEIKTIIEITEEELNSLKEKIVHLEDEIQNYNLGKNEYISTINELQEQLKKVGERPVIETNFNEIKELDEQQREWEEIDKNLKLIKRYIKDSGVYEPEYARFIFLYKKGIEEEYNVFEGKQFDDVIEKNLVIQNFNERYELNLKNKRNIKLIDIIDETEILLKNYIKEYGEIDENDLFEYSFSDPDFWDNYLNISVTI